MGQWNNFLWKITRVEDERFHTMVDNAMFCTLGNKMWLENIGNSVYAQSVWVNQVVRREISPVRERPARDGCPGGGRCPGGRHYDVFTSAMIQWHEWGHQNDLKQPSQVQDIFNLAVVECFGNIAFPWLQKGAVFTHFTTTFSRRERKGAPFGWKSRFWTKNPANAGETKKTKTRRKGSFSGESTKNRLPAPIFRAQLSNMI